MRKLPISDYMKGFLTEQGVELTDHQRASILWNSRRLSGRERLEAVRELGERTSDEILKRQIGERLAWEEEQARAFLENGDRSYVYMVSENDGPSAGAFSGFDAAMRFGAEQKKDWAESCSGEMWQKGFQIGKYLVAGEQPPLIHSPFRTNSHIWTEQEESPEYVPFDGDFVGGCRVSAERKIIFMKGVSVEKRTVRSEGTLGDFLKMYDSHRHMREEERRYLDLDPA